MNAKKTVVKKMEISDPAKITGKRVSRAQQSATKAALELLNSDSEENVAVESIKISKEEHTEQNLNATIVEPEKTEKIKPVSKWQMKREQSKRNRAEYNKRKNRQLVDFFSGIFVLLLLIAIAFFIGINMLSKKIAAPSEMQSEKIILIPKDYGLEAISKLLLKQGAIDNTAYFQAGVYLKGAATQLKAGEYAIPANSSMSNIIDILVDGQGIQYSVTIAEGLTSYQIVEKIKESEFLAGDAKLIPAEGTLSPNTYNFPRGTTRQQVLDRLTTAQKKIVDDVWAKRAADLPIKTKEELVTLASIVEKETGIASERPQVAAVFVNRLRKGMRLQSDPTIIYGIVGGKGALGRGITRSDITTKTAYNTYSIDALPPTPIANPGRSALEAVANPAKSNALYFVADGSGGHVFAATLEEHNANVAKWRELEKSMNVEPSEPIEVETPKQ